MKTKQIIPILSLLVATAWLSAGATVKVTNLHLQRSSQFTELTIECDSQFAFTHQIVEATGNKPYRIVVDIMDAVHTLPQHVYTSLPAGAVKQIRTSQYSSDPEKIVRVVLDVAGSLTYKAKENGSSLTLYINTPADKDFPKWSAVQTDANQTVVAKTESKTQTPKTMPANPENRANAPQVDRTQPDKKDLKLATKPIDEGKLLNKAAKPTETTTKVAAQPTTTATPVATKANEPSKNLKTTEPTPVKALPETKAVAAKTAATTETKATENPGVSAKIAEATPVKALPETKTVAAKTTPTTQTKATTVSPDANVKTHNSGQPLAGAAPAVSQAAKSVEPKTETKSLVDKTSIGTDTKTKPQGATANPQPAEGNLPTTKHADSVVMPTLKPGTGAPSSEPVDMTKPPKVQKSALPETKVNKAPKLAEDSLSQSPLQSKLATAAKGKGQTTSETDAEVKKPAATGEGATAGAPQSKSEAIRQRYLAGKGKVASEEQQTPDSSDVAGGEGPVAPLSDIDKIRMKYKHGIRFVQNDQDEQAQTPTEALVPEDTMPARTVGPYSEFLPEREIVVYTTEGRPDPFEPLLEEAASGGQIGDLPDVESLRLVGILQDKKGSRALFADFKGYSFILRTGDRVKNGFVLSIEESRVLFQIRQYGWNRQVAVDLDSEK